MDYPVQRLTHLDLELMRLLNKLFGEVFEDKESYCNNPPTDKYVTTFLSDQNTIVLVAMKDGEVIGGLVAYTLNKFEMERSEVFIYDLAVSKAYQHKGIGTGLVRKLQDIAAEVGAYVVFVQADEGDGAIDFYRSLGPIEDISTRNFDFAVK